jgi:prevent-host-death family protein
MVDIQKIIPLTTVKRKLLEIIKEIGAEDATITVTKNGVPVGVMMTPDRYEGLLETIEVLADNEIVKALSASARDYKAGRVFDHTDVWAE